MKQTGVKKLAYVLNILVLIVFACNLLALVLVPGMVNQRFRLNFGLIADKFRYDFDDGLSIFFDTAYAQVWQNPSTAVLTVFLWACGSCTAVVLWQGKRVLDTVLKENPFCMANARNLRRAAVCCFLISTFALVRMVWSIWYFQTTQPVFSYNALFVPIFLMAGLLCLVMSALFRQAAELKAENDLTI